MRDALKIGSGNRTVTVKREDLLNTLRENLSLHRRKYEEALRGYKEVAMRRLEKLKADTYNKIADEFQKIVEQIDKFDPERMDECIVLVHSANFRLAVPQDHSSSYEVAIRMAEWEVEDVITLTQAEFQCFVMDDWDWTREFQTISESYRRR